MMRQLARVACRDYGSIVKKYPNGLGNRMERFDEWAKTWNDPNVTCYYDFFYNLETGKFVASIPDSESSKNELAQCASRYRPVIAKLHDKLTYNENRFGDDHLLSIDATHLSFRRFVREGLSAETRTDVHLFFLWLCVAGVTMVAALYMGVLREDYKQEIIQLEPDSRFYHYNVNGLELEVKAYIEKINLINRHSQEVLREAKQKAEQRLLAKAKAKAVQKGQRKQ